MVMKFLRKKKNMKMILWAVAILIIPGFLIWGVGLGGGGRSSYYAATVNREPISRRDFYKNLNEMEQRYRQMFGEGAESFLKNINMEQIVLEDMIRERLLLQQAKKKRVRVQNSEIIEAIKSDPVFKDEKGNFSQARYKEIVSNYPAEEMRKIEDGIRKNITISKLRELVASEAGISVTDAEVDEYMKKNQMAGSDRESVRKNLMWQKGEEAYRKWYEETKKKSKIQVFLSMEKPVAPGAAPTEKSPE